MANPVLIGLGPYRFSTSSLNIQELQRTWDYRWEAVNRVGARPAMQFLGPGEETVRLRGVIYPHYCLAQHERILTSDLRWVASGDLREGDEILAFDEHAPEGRRDRRWRWGSVVRSEPARKECVRVHLDNDESIVCTIDHPWLAGYPTGRQPLRVRRWVRADKLVDGPRNNRRSNVGLSVIKAIKPWKTLDTYEAGWLGGVLDGEGSISAKRRGGIVAAIAQKPGAVLDRAKHILTKHGFTYIAYPRPGGVTVLELCGGFQEVVRLLGTFAPMRLVQNLRGLDVGGFASTKCFDRQLDVPKVVEVEPLGIRDIQSISTTTATYVGEGYLMHNTGGFGQLEDMRNEAAKGKTRGMVSGFGRYYGKWCIVSINDDQSLFFADGAPRKVEFDIELTHYG